MRMIVVIPIEQPLRKRKHEPRANRSHLKFDNDLPMLLGRSAASGCPAIADEGDWLVVSFVVDVI